jgi:hypothetical protein
MKKTIKKAQTGAKSDSLMKESNRKKVFAAQQEQIGKSLIKKGIGDKQFGLTESGDRIPTGKERMEIGRKARESAKKDSIASVKSRVKKQKTGGKTMLKRADGSVSQKGLWDNIRNAAKRNKAAGKPGKKPTAQMLKQERKIKANSKKK